MVTIKDIQKIVLFLTQLNNYGAGNKPQPRKFFKAKTIDELKQIKENNFIGKGNYENKNDASLEKVIQVQSNLRNCGILEVKNMLVCF